MVCAAFPQLPRRPKNRAAKEYTAQPHHFDQGRARGHAARRNCRDQQNKSNDTGEQSEPQFTPRGAVFIGHAFPFQWSGRGRGNMIAMPA